MKILSKERYDDKRIIRLFGMKILSYTKKNNSIDRRLRELQGQTDYNTAYMKRAYNGILCDKLSISNKRRIIERVFMKFGNKYFPDIEHPRSFNEKIHWLNLYYHNPLITKCTDKVSFKEYLKENGCADYIVPTIGVYNDVNEIDFDKLPADYVLKSNWGGDSSQVFLHPAENKRSVHYIKLTANQWLLPMENLYSGYFNWGYKDIKPKLMVEEMLKPSNGVLNDYKFMCFNGEPKVAFVVYDRRTNMALDFFDMDWKKLDFRRKYKNSKKTIGKPKNFELMKQLCEKLAKPFPFVRIDFYEVDGKLYIGEFTFTPGGGFEPFEPVEWDYTLGSWIKLPKKMLNKTDIE